MGNTAEIEWLRHGYHRRTPAELQLVAVGVALCRSDIVQVHHKRAMALEDVAVGLQVVEHGRQRGVELRALGMAVLAVADHHIVLLSFNVQQVVDGELQVVSPDAVVLDGNGDTFLLCCRLVEQ